MRKLYVSCSAFLFGAALVYGQIDSATTQVTVNLLSDTTPVKRQLSKKQDQVYHLKSGVDIPITAVGTGWSLYAFTKIYSKDLSSDAKILSLSESDVNGFDRWAIRPYSKRADDISYLPFYGSMPLPILFVLDKRMRRDMAKLSFMYLEAMSITGLLYTGSTYFTNRYRPYSYSDETPFDFRKRGGAKNSFYAGHVALVATSTFFMARVYADYHPDSHLKWVFYGVAGLATGTTAYLRHRGGLHFPSDILLGLTQGTLTGLLVPKLHKTRLIKDPNLSIIPMIGANKGLAIFYRL